MEHSIEFSSEDIKVEIIEKQVYHYQKKNIFKSTFFIFLTTKILMQGINSIPIECNSSPQVNIFSIEIQIWSLGL